MFILILLNISVLVCSTLYLWSRSIKLQTIEKESAELNKRKVILLEELGHKIYYIYSVDNKN